MTSILDRTQAPAIHSLSLPNLKNPENISKGVFAFFKESLDVFRLDFVFPEAGRGNSTFSKSNIIVGEMLMSGTSNFSAQELNEKLDFYGSYTNIATTYYKTTLTVFGLTKFFKEIVELIADALNNSIFPEQELEILKQQKVNNLKINQQKTQYQSSLLMNKLWYGENSFLGEETKEEDYTDISRETILADFEKNFQRFFVLLSVRDTLKSNINILQDLFASKLSNPNFTVSQEITFEKKLVSDINSFYKIENSNQASFNARIEVNPRKAEDYVNIAFLNLILGGYFGSRLMKNIREEKGWTYGVSSRIINYKNNAFLNIGGSIHIDKAIAVREEIKKEFEKLKTDLIKTDELETARNFYLGNLQASFDEFMALNERYLSMLETGDSIEWYNDFGEKLKAVTSEQLKETANNYLNQETLIYTWAGPIL